MCTIVCTIARYHVSRLHMYSKLMQNLLLRNALLFHTGTQIHSDIKQPFQFYILQKQLQFKRVKVNLCKCDTESCYECITKMVSYRLTVRPSNRTINENTINNTQANLHFCFTGSTEIVNFSLFV